MEKTPDFATMTETDVREHIVRPFIERLGYRFGTDANIRTEVPLRYGKAFLGRKNPNKDPDLVGRADYVCDVISYGRWVVEVKSPREPLTQEVVEQAHTYAAHPEIAASHFLVTNGRGFKLYQTSRLESPVLAWSFEDTEDNFLRIRNFLDPDAFQSRAKANLPDPGNPLGKGLSSRLRVISGEISYEDLKGNDPFLRGSPIDGLRLPVLGGSVYRTEDKRILGHIEISKPAPLITIGEHELSDAFDFFSASEFISDDPEHPTIFQNLVSKVQPAGKQINIPGLGRVPTQFGFSYTAFTEAIGYVAGGMFVGMMRLLCDIDYSKMGSQVRQALAPRLGTIPDRSRTTGTGRFRVSLLPDL